MASGSRWLPFVCWGGDSVTPLLCDVVPLPTGPRRDSGVRILWSILLSWKHEQAPALVQWHWFPCEFPRGGCCDGWLDGWMQHDSCWSVWIVVGGPLRYWSCCWWAAVVHNNGYLILMTRSPVQNLHVPAFGRRSNVMLIESQIQFGWEFNLIGLLVPCEWP